MQVSTTKLISVSYDIWTNNCPVHLKLTVDGIIYTLAIIDILTNILILIQKLSNFEITKILPLTKITNRTKIR